MDSVIEYVTVPFMGFDVKDDVMDDCGHTPNESGSYLLHEEQLITNLEESTGHGGLRSYGYPAF